MKLNLGRDSEARFGQDFEVLSLDGMLMFGQILEVDAVKILKIVLIKIFS